MKTYQKKIDLVFIVLAVSLYLSGNTLAAKENNLEEARKHMELGQAAFNNKSYSEALIHFQSAYEAAPFAAFLYNAGLACERGNKPKTALEFYRRYLSMEPEAPDRPKIEEKIKTLEEVIKNTPVVSEPIQNEQTESPSSAPTTTVPQETPDSKTEKSADVEMKSLVSVQTNPQDALIRILDSTGKTISSLSNSASHTVEKGTYVVEASHPDYKTVSTEITVSSGQVYVVVVEMSQGSFLGYLKVVTDIPGANVFLDNREAGVVGTTPFGNVATSGKHKVYIEKPGYVAVEREVVIGVSDEFVLNETLTRLSFGAVKVKTNIENAEVFINDQSVGITKNDRTIKTVLSSGKYRIRVSAEDMKDYETEAVVEGGSETSVLVRMNPKPSRTSGYVSAGFSLVVFGSGAAFGGIALKTKHELEDYKKSGMLSNDDPRIMKGFLWAVGADISFAVGTLIAGMSLYHFLKDKLPPSEGKVLPPVDFTENPKEEPLNIAEKTEIINTPPKRTKADRAKWIFSPLVGKETAGIGFQLAF